jgi:hypothetical protein
VNEGYPGCEFQIRDALASVIGEEKSEFFFDKVREDISINDQPIDHVRKVS